MLHVVDAGLLAYLPAWEMQLQLHDQVITGQYADGALMLVEHPSVITIGRRADAEKHLLASPALLKLRGVEVVETDRGGDITFHGPGQLVAYPIVPLNAYGLNLHSYLRLLEQVIIDTVGGHGIAAMRDTFSPPATGVWVTQGAGLAKIAAIGIKVRRWITLHGLALNVSTDLSSFDLINPCGLSRPVTSMKTLLGEKCPAMGSVKESLVEGFSRALQDGTKHDVAKE